MELWKAFRVAHKLLTARNDEQGGEALNAAQAALCSNNRHAIPAR
jgi:hypothetical protein